MFTGLVEAVGQIVERQPQSGGARVRIGTALASELAPGDSVAVNGVCLTVIALDADGFQADLGPETLRVTTLGSLDRGALVNLERPLRADSRFGGHFVQGHVDGVGLVENLRQDADFHWLTMAFPAALAPYFVPKGSIAIDGISLTIAALDDEWFDVQVIPHTWLHTTLSAARVGDALNLECDLVGKYVVRLATLERRGRLPQSL